MLAECREGRTILFLILVMVVYSYQTADEGEDFAEGNEDGGVDGADRRESKGGGEQCAPEDAHCDCREELKALHTISRRVWRTLAQKRNHIKNSISSAL